MIAICVYLPGLCQSSLHYLVLLCFIILFTFKVSSPHCLANCNFHIYFYIHIKLFVVYSVRIVSALHKTPHANINAPFICHVYLNYPTTPHHKGCTHEHTFSAIQHFKPILPPTVCVSHRHVWCKIYCMMRLVGSIYIYIYLKI